MELKTYIDDIESICSTCDGCDTSCVGHTFKNCLKSEMEIEEALHTFNLILSKPHSKSLQV